MTKTTGLVLALCLIAPQAALAAEAPQQIGTFKDWLAYTVTEGKAKTCYIASEPVKQEGTFKSRGRPFALVTNRPSENVAGQPSFLVGYPYKDKSEPTATVANRAFKLFAEGDTAWVRDDDGGDSALVEAMKKGATLVVRATSQRETTSTDTYSLDGFTAALQAIDEACKAP